MFAVAMQDATHWMDSLTFNWFDMALLAIIIIGLWRGRKNGMSREFLPTTQWLLIVVGGGFAAIPAAKYLTQWGVTAQLVSFVKAVFESSATERGVGLVWSYLLIALFISIIFSVIKRRMKAKVEGSSAFGSSEYYLGMISGVIRFACITVFTLALLNCPFYSQVEVDARMAADKKNFGGGLYAGNYFPHLFNIQQEIFKKSLSGPYIKTGLHAILLEDGTGDVKKPEKKTDNK